MKNFSTKSFIHPIARNYFNTISAGGGNVVDKNLINQFVIGLNNIIDSSLWVCWPLISTQNIGTGSTVFSLGGLLNTNLSLISGPTWGNTGIVSAGGAGSEISTSALPDVRTGSLINVGTSPTVGTNVMICNSASRSNGTVCRFTNDGSSVTASTIPVSTTITIQPLTSSFSYYTAIRGDTTFRAAKNLDTFTEGTATTPILNPISRLIIANREDGGQPTACTTAFTFFSVLSLTQLQKNLIYTLYKNTLGATLGLP